MITLNKTNERNISGTKLSQDVVREEKKSGLICVSVVSSSFDKIEYFAPSPKCPAAAWRWISPHYPARTTSRPQSLWRTAEHVGQINKQNLCVRERRCHLKHVTSRYSRWDKADHHVCLKAFT